MLFKADAKGDASELQNYIRIAKATAFSSFAPYIRRVELSSIIPLIGKELYDRVNIWYNAAVPDVAETAILTALLPYLQEPIANISYLMGFNSFQIKTSDMGISRIETDTEKSLFQYQEKNIKEDLKTIGFNALDLLLDFLEADQKAQTILFPEFTQYSGNRLRYLINSAKEFTQFYPMLNNSHLVFKKLTVFIQQVQDLEISSKLSRAFVEELLEQVKTSTLTPDNAKILNMVQNAIAWFSIAKASQILGYEITDKGFLFSEMLQNTNNMLQEKLPSPDKLRTLVNIHYNSGLNYLQGAIDYMTIYSDLYPTFTTNILNTNALRQFNNTNKKTFTML